MMAAEKPTIRPFDGSAIPQPLKEQKRWAPWKAIWNEKKQKFEKVPHRADRPEFGISSAKPQQWFSFEVALAAFRRNPSLFAGIGYVMTGPHDVVGTDLDHCVVDGVVAPWAMEVVAQLASYTEISPSGNGLRILSFGEQPNDWVNHEVGIEMYGGNEARFLTVTGEHLAGTPLEMRRPAEPVLQALEAQYAKERRKADVIDLNMPEVLDELVLPDVASLDVPPATREFLIDGLHSGDRSRALFTAALSLYATGLADDEVFSLLVSSPHAMEIALDHRRQDHDRALLYIWREHCCKGKARAAELAPLSLDDFEALPDEPRAPGDRSPVKEARFRVLSTTEFTARKPVTWIVKGIVPKAELVVLFGDSGSGKSFFALDLAGAVDQGKPWRDRKTTKGRTVYVAAEGAGGFRNRMVAYCEHNGIEMADLGLGVIPDAPNLMEKADIKDLVAAIKAFGPVDMVIIDTFAQSFQGNENSGEDMSRALAHCKAIHRATGAVIMLVAHSGKDASRGVRGWSGLRGAADAQIEIVRAGEHRSAIIDKQKDGGGERDEFAFKLNTVAIGEDEDGETITSCVLEHTATVPKAERKKEPKGSIEKIVLKVAIDLAELSGEGTPFNTLIEACVAQMPVDPEAKRDRRREMTMRAFEALQAANRVSVLDGLVGVL